MADHVSAFLEFMRRYHQAMYRHYHVSDSELIEDLGFILGKKPKGVRMSQALEVKSAVLEQLKELQQHMTPDDLSIDLNKIEVSAHLFAKACLCKRNKDHSQGEPEAA